MTTLDDSDIPYPAGHNWEGLTPKQVNQAYTKKDLEDKQKELSNLVKLKKRLKLVNELLRCVNYEDEYLELVKEKEDILSELEEIEKTGITIKSNIFNSCVVWSIYDGNKLRGYFGEKL